MTHLVCLIRLCTRFQYLRNPVYVFFVLEEGIRFRVAMFFALYNVHVLYFLHCGASFTIYTVLARGLDGHAVMYASSP
jgi:hypothetical protein